MYISVNNFSSLTNKQKQTHFCDVVKLSHPFHPVSTSACTFNTTPRREARHVPSVILQALRNKMREMQPGVQQQRPGDEGPGERLPHRVFPLLGV